MSAPKASADLRKMTKEEMRALEGEKDVDSLEEVEKKDAVSDKKEMASTKCTVDIASLRRSYDRLFALDNQIFEAGLVCESILTKIIANKEFAGECFNDALLQPRDGPQVQAQHCQGHQLFEPLRNCA